jgi:hypothetical protein
MSDDVPFSPAQIEDMVKSRRRIYDEIIENVHHVEYEYWGSLLTFDGLLLTVFSIFGLQNKANQQFATVLIVMGIIFCLISAILLIWNFYSRLKTYLQHLILFSPLRVVQTQKQLEKNDEEINQYLPEELKEKIRREKNTVWAILLMSVQGLIVIIVLFVVTGLYQEIVRFFCLKSFLWCR